MLVKKSLEFVVNAYVEQFIVYVKVIYKANANMEVKYCNYKSTLQSLSTGQDYRGVFLNKNSFNEALLRDRNAYLKFMDSFSQFNSKELANKVKARLVLLGEVLIKKKGEFDNMINKILETFPEKSSELIEAILIIRDDVDSQHTRIPRH